MGSYWKRWEANSGIVRRACACLLAAVLLFSTACTAGPAASQPTPIAPSITPVPTVPAKAADNYLTISTKLYFPDLNGNHLVLQMRNITIEPGSTRERAALEQLLQGPMDDLLRPIIPEDITVSVERVDRSDDLAMVYLSAEFRQLEGLDMLIARMAIVNTMTELPGVNYCSVLSDGREVGLDGRPFDVMGKYTGDLLGYWLLWQHRITTQLAAWEEPTSVVLPESRQTALYYADASGSFLLPEVRTLLVDREQYVQAIIQELRKGPADTAGKRALFADELMLVREPEWTLMEDGAQMLTLYFHESSRAYWAQHEHEQTIFYGALVMSITQFMPTVGSIRIMIGGQPMSKLQGLDHGGLPQGVLRRDMFDQTLLGNTVLLYFPNAQMNALLQVNRALHYRQGQSPRGLLLELLRGPKPDENLEAVAALSEQFTERDIITAVLEGDMAVVNISEHFRELCASLNATQERMLVFSMVNTLTRLDGVRRVQFLVEGKPAQGYFAQDITLQSPLIYNPGIVQKQ